MAGHKHHHHGRHHNRPPVSATKLNAKAAKLAHRKHGTVTTFNSDALDECKVFKTGGALLTFVDGSQYLTDLDAADAKDLADASSTGRTWNFDYR